MALLPAVTLRLTAARFRGTHPPAPASRLGIGRAFANVGAAFSHTPFAPSSSPIVVADLGLVGWLSGRLDQRRLTIRFGVALLKRPAAAARAQAAAGSRDSTGSGAREKHIVPSSSGP